MQYLIVKNCFLVYFKWLLKKASLNESNYLIKKISYIYNELNDLYGDRFVHHLNALCLTHYPEMSEINTLNNLVKQCEEKSTIETIKFRQIANNVSSSLKTSSKLDFIFNKDIVNNFRKRKSTIRINYGICKNKISINRQEINNQIHYNKSSKSDYITISRIKKLSNVNDNILTLDCLYNYII